MPLQRAMSSAVERAPGVPITTAIALTRRYLTDAIFPHYIVHQTAIILIAHGLRGSGVSAGVEAAIVIGGTAATCVAAFEARGLA